MMSWPNTLSACRLSIKAAIESAICSSLQPSTEARSSRAAPVAATDSASAVIRFLAGGRSLVHDVDGFLDDLDGRGGDRLTRFERGWIGEWVRRLRTR